MCAHIACAGRHLWIPAKTAAVFGVTDETCISEVCERARTMLELLKAELNRNKKANHFTF